MGTIYKDGIQYGGGPDLNASFININSQNLSLKDTLQNLVGNFAQIETNPSTHAYNINDLLVYNGALYKVIAAISVNDALIIGSNIASTTIDNNKIDYNDIVNNATTNDSTKVASAAVAKSLKDQITTLESSTTFSATISSAITDATVQTNQGQVFPGIKLAVYDLCIYSANGEIPTNNNAIATIPSNYRPSSNIIGQAIVIPKAGAYSFTDVRIERAYIDTNGKLALNNFIYGTSLTTIIFAHFAYRYS